MANKYDIIHIDFQASARGANAAIESIRKEAETSSAKINQLKQDIDKALKSGASDQVISDLRAQRKAEEKRYSQLSKAQNELIKGMRVLDEGVKQFNNGALSQMNAAFQKSVNNAAKLAQSKMTNGTKEWREMAAIMQETEQNYARMQRDTDLLIENLQNGGTVFRKTLEDEKKGLNDLLQVLPYMGTEYRKIEEQLQFLVKTTDEMAIKERQLKGEIVTTNDARRVRLQLTKEGAEAARQAADAAQVEIDEGKKLVDTYEKEREGIEAKAKASAEAAAKYTEELQMYDDLIDIYEKEIKANKRSFKERQQKAELLRAEANEAKNNAEAQREAQKIVDKAYDDTKAKVENLKQQLKDLKAGVTTEVPKTDPTTEAIKTGAHEASLEVAELDRRLKKLAEDKAEKQKIIDSFEAKYGKTFDEQDAAQQKIIKEAQQKDSAAQDEAIKKVTQRWNAYWEKQKASAEEFAASIGKTLEQLGLGDITSHLDGPMADKAKSAYRVVAYNQYELSEALSRDGELTRFKHAAIGYGGNEAPEAKVIESLQRKYNEYIKSLKEAKQIETEYAPVHKALKEEHDTYIAAKGELAGLQKVENEWLQKRAALTNEDVQTTEKQTAAKKEEAKIEEQVVETQKQEQVTVEQLQKKNDELIASIKALNEEKAKLIEQQEQSAKAAEAETNAFKDLTQEQAKSRLEQKQAKATFKNEGGKWQITNREEAQKYLFDAMAEIEPSYVGKTKIEGSSAQSVQLMNKFRERYGLQSEDEAMHAIRELMSGEGLIKQGGINRIFVAIDQNVQKFDAYEKEIKDLTEVINGEVKVVEEDTAAKQRLAEINEEIARKEAESAEISRLTGKIFRGEIDLTQDQIKNTEDLAEARKKNAEAAKAELEAIKNLSREDALAKKAEMTAKSTLSFKGGKIDASNIEQVQAFLYAKAREINPDTIAEDGKIESSMKKGYLQVSTKELPKGKDRQLEKLIAKFKEAYGLGDLKKDDFQELFKQVITAEGGLFKKGGTVDFSKGTLNIPFDKEAYDLRIAKLKELVKLTSDNTEATGKLSEATEKGSKASKESTKETGEQTKAIGEQIAKVNQRYEAYQAKEKEYNDKMVELEKKRKAMSNLPKSGPDAGLQRTQLEDEIKDYNENVVSPARKERNKLKKLWEKSAQELVEMQGIEQEAPTRRGTKAKNDDTKAIKDNTQATEENTQARRKNAKTSEEEAQRKQKELELKQQLADAEKELSDADKKKKEEERKTTRMDRESENLQQKAAEAERNVGGKAEESLKNLKEAQELREQLKADNKDTLKNNEDNQKQLADINEKLKEQTDRIRENEQIKAQANTQGIEKTEQAIRLLEDENRRLDQNSFTWKRNTLEIQALQEALDEMKQKPVLMMMEKRMERLPELSDAAFKETKKFWEAMEAGAEKGSKKLEEAQGHVQALIEEERNRTQKSLVEKAARLGSLDNYSVGEVREGIEAAKKLQETYKLSEDKVSNLSKQIVDAETRIAKVGIEAERQAQKQAESIRLMEEQLGKGADLTESALKAQVQYWQRLADDPKTAAEAVKEYTANMQQAQDLLQEKHNESLERKVQALSTEDIGLYSIEELQEGIEAAKEMQKTFVLTDEEIKQLSESIVQAEKRINDVSVESVRAAEKQRESIRLMEEQLEKGDALTESALKAQVQYWQRLADDPKTAAESIKQYVANMQQAQDLLQEKHNKSLEEKVQALSTEDLGVYSIDELQEGIAAAKEMQKTWRLSDEEIKQLSESIVQAEKRINDVSVESVRAAEKQRESIRLMEEQLDKGADLTESALKAQVQYWQRLADDPKTAAEAVAKYTANMQQAQKILDDRSKVENQQKAQIVLGGTLGNYSEQEIRESIDAAKALRNEMKSGSDEAARYAVAIAKAESHIKNYGVEAARSALQQRQSDKRMQDQLNRMIGDMQSGSALPTESQLKAQHQYWQRLIDDPKTAAKSLSEYRARLAEVEELEKNIVEIRGKAALSWFQDGRDKNARENTIKEAVSSLKEYRGTLLKETDADKIAQIDEILQRVGASAKKAAEDVMSLDDAFELAEKAAGDIYGSKNPAFLASPEEIQAAIKAIEKYREEIFKVIKAKRDMGESTEAEEEMLRLLADDLKNLKFEQDNFNMSREKMETLIKTPFSATNLDELRAAIKRADAELKRMEGSLGRNKDEYKAFAKQVKEAKNTLKDMEGQARATSSVWEKAWSRLKTYVGMYMGFNMAWQRITGTADDLLELSDKMGEVRKTTGFTADEVGRLSENLKKLDVRTPLTELMTISAKAGQLDLKSEQDVMGFTEAANKLMIALPEMGAEAATEMMKVAIATGEVKKIQDQMNQGLIDGSSATEVALSKVGSTIDQLRANSAAAAPAITDFVKRVGAVGAQSGITIDQVAALGATVDALGMRVEMSATALSRMIPAIKNNAFQVANAIGMAPNALRAMFDEAGGGMEAILAIFQHIKDAGMDPDSIEHLLGMGGLKEVMKELNQQGARAGIVFAGLSQNVDELRKNLVTAHDAYEDNIAILQEYNKMNETAAAKWARFKNQIEETFVSDTAQRWLGGFIDLLRGLFGLFTDNHGFAAALRTIIVYFGLIKLNILGALTSTKAWSLNLSKIAVTIGLIDKETKKLQWGNIFTALAAAALWAWHEISMMKTALEKANEALGKTKEEVGFAIERFEGYWIKLKDTSAALLEARASHEKLSAEVDKLRKSTDGSAESTANLKKKEDELEKSEMNVTRASNEHKSAISQMNSIYGKYLGFILTETNYTNLAAAAHDKVTAAIEREMLVKQQQAAIGEVDSNYSQDIAKGYGDLNERLVNYGKLDRRDAARAMSDMQKFMRENLRYDAASNKTIVSKTVTDQLKKSGLDVSDASANEIAALWFNQYLEKNFHISEKKREGITGVGRTGELTQGWQNVRTPFATNLRGDYAETYANRERDRGAVSAVYGVDIAESERKESTAAGTLLKKLETTAKNAKNTILDK